MCESREEWWPDLALTALHFQNLGFVPASTVMDDHYWAPQNLLSCPVWHCYGFVAHFPAWRDGAGLWVLQPPWRHGLCHRHCPKVTYLNRMGIMGFTDKLWERESW